MKDAYFTLCKTNSLMLIPNSNRFATKDQKEGMAAFAEKRAPNFKNE